MIGQKNGCVFQCVLIDLNTQHDFCEPEGARPVVNSSRLLPALRKVIAWAKRNQVPVVSSVESKRPWEISDSAMEKAFCVDGTRGQRKVGFTVFPSRTGIEVDNTLALPRDLFTSCQQVVFRKRTSDLLCNPKADRFLTHLHVEEFIVIGNCLERDVKAITLGLMTRNYNVTVVLDACGYWDQAQAELAVRQMWAKGANFIQVDELWPRKLERRFRYPSSSRRIASQNGRGNRTSTAMSRWYESPKPSWLQD